MMSSIFDVAGDVALVIGAGPGGLGEAAALALRDHGATIVAAEIADRAHELEATARDHGFATILECDVTREDSLVAVLEQVLQRYGRIDTLVNASGTMLRKPYNETSVEEFRRVIDVNLTGTWLAARVVGETMAAQGAGTIVNFSTVYANRVGPYPESAYYASKAGVANVTRALAAELGPSGVRVNCLAPGVFYPTRMTAPLAQSPDRLEFFTSKAMLGRLGNVQTDLAGPLLLLASKASAYMTGQVVYVDGGWSAW